MYYKFCLKQLIKQSIQHNITRRIIFFGFILFLAKTAFTLECLQQIKQGDQKTSFENSEPLNGDLKCGTFEFTVQSNEMKGQNFIIYSSFPSNLCGKTLNKIEISALIPKLENINFEVETSKIDCCEGNFCNGFDAIKATSFVVVVCNTLAWLFLA